MDVFAHPELAVMTGRGGFRVTGGYLLKRHVPDDAYDESRVLPDVVQCCHAFQIVLKQAAERVAELAGLGKKDAQTLVEVVRSIWFQYVHCWKEAAEKYGKLYPELRFSFRDGFLSTFLKRSIVRHLSAVVAEEREKKKKEEGIKGEEDGVLGIKQEEEEEEESDSDSSSSSSSSS
eukprot:6687957-Ditylum_brightwellii.AAC.1